MDLLVTLLALVGFGAVALRLLQSAFQVSRWAVDAFAARERARTRARRGDLTGMVEAQRQIGTARRSRIRASATGALWFALLISPPLTPWTRYVYAVYGLAAVAWWGARERRPRPVRGRRRDRR